MRQLVELQSHADDFKAANAELIFVFREESKGVEGLKIIKDKYKSDFTLAIDPNKQSSKAYSPKNRTFDNYVVSSDGKVRGIVDGTLRTRAKAEQLLEILKKIK